MDNTLTLNTKAINKGVANVGIYLHHLHSPMGDGLKLIEKRTTLRSEVNIAHTLSAVQREHPCYAIFPWIHGVDDDGEVAQIYMEYLATASAKFDFSDMHLAVAVATCIGQLHDCFPDELAATSPTQRLQCLQQSFARQFKVLDDEELDLQYAFVAKHVEPSIASWPLVMSHNDLTPENLAVTEQGVRLIDFGLCQASVLGGEFHHFLRDSLIKPHKAAFYNKLVTHYASLAQVPRQDVETGASYYALKRAIWRLAKHHKNGQATKLAAERKVVEALFNKLKDLQLKATRDSKLTNN